MAPVPSGSKDVLRPEVGKNSPSAPTQGDKHMSNLVQPRNILGTLESASLKVVT